MKTPQTDDIARGNHVVPTEWAQQLERERDEALSQIVQAECRAERFCQERDEAMEALMKIEEIFINCEDTYVDFVKTGNIAREALKEVK